MSISEVRPLILPWEGVESLRTILGIVDDHELKVDEEARASLDDKLDAAPRAMGPIGAGTETQEVAIGVTMAEADLLLAALRFTDMMSMHLPFYDMVVETVQFVSDQLTGLWPAEVWMAWRDANK
jgi:hypothetical protein